MKKRKAEKWAIKMCKAHSNKHYFRSKIYSCLMRVFFSCEMQGSVQFHETAQLVHNGLGCVFHPKTVIGPNCKIYQNVTIGGNGKIVNGKKTNAGAPILEENVAVFAGACVLGPIRIGANSIIGANAVITKDVPPNSLVIGNPAVIKELKFIYNFE